MDIMNFIAGGAVLGVIAGCWARIKAVTWRVASLFVQRVELTSPVAHNAVIAYLIRHHRRSTWYDMVFGAAFEYQRDGKYGVVAFEQYGFRSLVFWQGWRPLLVSNEQNRSAPQNPTQPGAAPANQGVPVHSAVTFVRGTIDVEAILREACRYQNAQTWAANSTQEQKRHRFAIYHVPERDDDNNQNHGGATYGLPWYQQAQYRLVTHDQGELGKLPLRTGRALANLIYPRHVEELIREIELWRASRDWYQQRGIPWKRGWLLYGPPGTGKTALARAFAEDLNMPIYVYNLAELGNNQLISAWRDMQVNTPCVALIEDIDNVFHGRENVSRKGHMMMPLLLGRKDDEDDGKDRGPLGPLTFDCLLNCLDGVERSEGIFTIITTNDIHKVDPALGQPRRLPTGQLEFISTRPGRIDKAIELSYMEPGDKKRLARRILGDYPDELRAMFDFIDRHPDVPETPAQFQERCAQVALATYWQQQDALAATTPAAETDTDEFSAVTVCGPLAG